MLFGQGYAIFWKELDRAVEGMGFDSLYSSWLRSHTCTEAVSITYPDP